MTTAFRQDLLRFLADFIEHHRGLRLGRLFGRPAGYAGRRMFVCLKGRSLLVKRSNRGWVTYTPKDAREAARLIPILEVAARDVVRP